MKIRSSSLYKAGIYFCIIWDTILLSMFNLQMGGKRYSVMICIAALLTVMMFLNQRIMKSIGHCCRWPKYYVGTVIVMLACHVFYALGVKGVSFGAFAHNAWYYLICLFVFPILFVLYKDDGIEKLFKVINITMLIWYTWLLVQFVAYETSGMIISPALSGVRLRNDSMRLEMKALAHVAIIYNFDKFYNQEDKKNKIKHFLMSMYGIAIMVIVEQTRGYFIAVFGAIAVLIMCYNKKTIKFFTSGLIVMIAILIIYRTQLFSSFLETLFSTAESGNTGATGLVRLRGMELFLKQFLHNPIFGFGFQETGDFVYVGGWQYYFNDNGFIGLVGQIGIWAFIIYGIMIVRFGYITRKAFRYRDYRRGTLLLGLYIYMLLTSISLICYWNTTCLLCPFLWAVFEYEYSRVKVYNMKPILVS